MEKPKWSEINGHDTPFKNATEEVILAKILENKPISDASFEQAILSQLALAFGLNFPENAFSVEIESTGLEYDQRVKDLPVGDGDGYYILYEDGHVVIEKGKFSVKRKDDSSIVCSGSYKQAIVLLDFGDEFGGDLFIEIDGDVERIKEHSVPFLNKKFKPSMNCNKDWQTSQELVERLLQE